MRLGLVLVVFLTYWITGCSAMHTEGWKNLDSEDTSNPLTQLPNNGQGVTPADSIAAFEQTLHPILVQNCGGCHGGSQFPLHSAQDAGEAHDNIIAGNLVDFANPSGSRLVVKINGGHQNFPTTVGDEIEAGIQQWVDILAASVPEGEPLPIDTPVAIPLTASFKSIHQNILQPRCVGCHNPTSNRPEDYSTYESTIATGEVTPGDPQDSAMLEECVDGSMPQDSDPLTQEEIDAIRQWIADGAPNN